MIEEEDAHFLRREMDRIYAERLLHMETCQKELEVRVNHELEGVKDAIRSMNGDLQHLIEKQAEHEPTMVSLDRIVGAGLILRWIVIFVVSAMATIGTVATTWDSFQKWLK